MPFRVFNSLSLMYKKNYVLNTPPPPPQPPAFSIIYINFISFFHSYIHVSGMYQWITNRIRIVLVLLWSGKNFDCQPGHCPVLNIWWQARSLKFLVTLGMQTCDFNPWKYAALNWLGDILILLYVCKKETSSF